MAKLSGQPLLCDSSSLISLTDSCFVHALYFLKKRFSGRFIIPPSVEYECISRPRTIAAHAMHALRLKRAVNDGIIDVVHSPNPATVKEVRFLANNLFFASGTPIQLLHEGESEVLALANELDLANIMIDERTTRMIVESPSEFRAHLEYEFHQPVSINEEHMQSFSRFVRGIRFFRSSEIILLAAEKGFFEDYGGLEREAIEAAVYKLKYAGCAVGFSEISGYSRKSSPPRKSKPHSVAMQDLKHPKIAADLREPDSVCDCLEALGADLDLSQLELGDYQLSDRLIVERKTRKDFEASIFDGRLFSQVEGLSSSVSRVVLVVEGEPDSESRLTRAALLGAYAAIISDFGCSLFFTRSPQATAELLFHLACHEQFSRHQQVSVYAKRKARSFSDQQRGVIESLPNVGPKLAESLLSYFDTIENVATAPESELALVDKVGKKKAAELRRLFTLRYISQKKAKGEASGKSKESPE